MYFDKFSSLRYFTKLLYRKTKQVYVANVVALSIDDTVNVPI